MPDSKWTADEQIPCTACYQNDLTADQPYKPTHTLVHHPSPPTRYIYRGCLFVVDVPWLRNLPASELCQIAQTSTSAPIPAAWSSAPWGLLSCLVNCTVSAIQYIFFHKGGITCQQSYYSSLHLLQNFESNPDHIKFTCHICSQCINKKYKGSVLCISCKYWVHTTCTTLTNTKQYINIWTCAKWNAQATPPATTPLVLSNTNITPIRPTSTPT